MKVAAVYLDKQGHAHQRPTFMATDEDEAHLKIYHELAKPESAELTLAVALNLESMPFRIVADLRSFEDWTPSKEERVALIEKLTQEELAKLPPVSSRFY